MTSKVSVRGLAVHSDLIHIDTLCNLECGDLGTLEGEVRASFSGESSDIIIENFSIHAFIGDVRIDVSDHVSEFTIRDIIESMDSDLFVNPGHINIQDHDVYEDR